METAEKIFEMAQKLPKAEQWSLLEKLLGELKGPEGKKERKGKKGKDPEAPKRPMTGYMELLNKHVWPILKELSEKAGEVEKIRMRSVGCRTKVASALWAKSKEVESHTKEDIVEAYRVWKVKTAWLYPETEKKVEAVETEEVQPEEWEHDFGEGEMTYERVVHGGKSYIYDIATKEYMGAYNAKKNILDLSVPDILAE